MESKEEGYLELTYYFKPGHEYKQYDRNSYTDDRLRGHFKALGDYAKNFGISEIKQTGGKIGITYPSSLCISNTFFCWTTYLLGRNKKFKEFYKSKFSRIFSSFIL